jgi:hypothetical protein
MIDSESKICQVRELFDKMMEAGLSVLAAGALSVKLPDKA